MRIVPISSRNKDLYRSIINTYLNWVITNYPNLDEFNIVELLRISLCNILSLDSSSSNRVISELVSDCTKELNGVVPIEVINSDIIQRQGFLEACIHCIEYSRKRCSK